jgi:hypothetical protein
MSKSSEANPPAMKAPSTSRLATSSAPPYSSPNVNLSNIWSKRIQTLSYAALVASRRHILSTPGWRSESADIATIPSGCLRPSKPRIGAPRRSCGAGEYYSRNLHRGTDRRRIRGPSRLGTPHFINRDQMRRHHLGSSWLGLPKAVELDLTLCEVSWRRIKCVDVTR